jgi:formylglycine-generating enzyme required for sulfatase activity
VASELQAEYDRLPLALRPAVAPRALLKESRRRVRRQLVGALAGLVGVLVVAGVLAANYGSTLFHRLADVGVAHLRFSLTERDYDGNWNRVPADRFPEFRWEIRQMGQAADNPAGTVVQPLSSSRIPDPHSKEAWVYRIEMPADRYMLVVYGRHREGEEPCGPSLVYPWNSPGFASREEDEASLTIAAVWVPTCAETRRDLVSIPEGVTFPGPHVQQPDMPLVPSQVHAFDIDDREVSQGAFRKFASTLSGLAGFSGLPVEWQLDVEEAGDPDVLPAVMVNWWQARSYCLWLGKDLPTEVEWVAAGRGVYPAGESWKREEVTRPFPWGDRVPTYGEDHIVAHHTIWRRDNGGLLRFRAPVTCCPGSRGPYPVFNLSGNVMEWVRDTVYAQPGGVVSPPPPGESGPYRLALGGHFRSAAFNELRLGSRRVLPPSAAITMMGFRCAVQSLESSAVQLDP